jgi:hypothetical protein
LEEELRRRAESPFGRRSTNFRSWETSAEMKDGKLLFLRKLQLETSTLPPERHFEVRDFVNEISRSKQAPVVLLRR